MLIIAINAEIKANGAEDGLLLMKIEVTIIFICIEHAHFILKVIRIVIMVTIVQVCLRIILV
jgi:hypothetical protein